jgi:hypothetical protein
LGSGLVSGLVSVAGSALVSALGSGCVAWMLASVEGLLTELEDCCTRKKTAIKMAITISAPPSPEILNAGFAAAACSCGTFRGGEGVFETLLATSASASISTLTST